MRCPYCKAEGSRVLDSRPTEEGTVIRRRRECPACSRRFTTYEKVEEAPFSVIKKDGRREPFDRAKILTGLLKACEKRPVSIDELERVATEVEREVRDTWSREVTSKEIGEKVMERLRALDEVAYVRFASVYRQFKDLQRFREELDRLLEE